MIEYIGWYQSGSALLRCQSCGALVVSGDTELHTKWHERFEAIEALAVRIEDKVQSGRTARAW